MSLGLRFARRYKPQLPLALGFAPGPRFEWVHVVVPEGGEPGQCEWFWLDALVRDVRCKRTARHTGRHSPCCPHDPVLVTLEEIAR